VSDARLFVAVELPGRERELLARWGSLAAEGDPALRAVREEALHITLHFLGSRPEAEIGALADAVRESGAHVTRPVDLRLAGSLWLAPRRPHVLTCAVGDVSDDLASLQRSLAGPLADAAPRWTSGHRDLTPHITVARVHRGARPRVGAEPAAPTSAFSAAALTLLRSWLGRPAARYEALQRFELPR